MELFLIRHADAVPLGEGGITDDELRPLTDKGEGQSKALGKCLKKRGLTFDVLLTSPLVRARQTTELLLKASGQTEARVVQTSGLTPNARPKKLSRELLGLGEERVALVGHMPHLGIFAAWICGCKKAQIDFAKAGIAKITCGDSPIKGNGTLEWLVTPEWFE